MKIKFLRHAFVLVAMATMFTFCSKEEQPVPAQETTAAENTVADRGLCPTTITTYGGAVTVCGTQTNPTICSTIGNVNLLGTGFIPANGSATYNLVTPAVLLITSNPANPSAAITRVSVSSGNGIKKLVIPSGATVQVTVDGNCIPL